jgi:hypothetical protein
VQLSGGQEKDRGRWECVQNTQKQKILKWRMKISLPSWQLKTKGIFNGITRESWLGKHWIRWSEALAEAGYQPNRFSSPPLGKENIIKELLIYFRSLNRIPMFREIQMAKRKNKQIPSITTIKSNFENKTYAEIKQELLTYCINNNEFADLVNLLEKDNIKISETSFNVFENSAIIGYVYLIKHGNRQEYKIGRTNNILRREGEISIELPEKIKPIWTIKTDDPSGIESYWHNRFKEKRLNSEWFNLSINDVTAFKKWKKIL